MKLSVIIVSYNVRYYLWQCLDSLQRATKNVETEIYVIDNHSKDRTVEMLSDYFKDVKFIACNHNHGFAKANNIAIRQTNSEYVLLLNPDTFVGENTIKECISFMDADNKVGGLGVCMLKSDGGKAFESRRGLPTPMTAFYKMCGLCARFPQNKRYGRYYMCGLPWDKPGKIEVVSGAFFMIRKRALDEAGLLDEDFFMYGEDIDLSFRLLECGYENWYYPSKILHYKGESTKKSSFRYVHVFYEAMLIFFSKHYSHLSFWFYIPIKIAIYLKAFLALIRLLGNQIRKVLGFSMHKRKKKSHYIFIGTKYMLERCMLIAGKNGISATYITGDEALDKPLLDEIIADIPNKGNVYMVYDTASYRYETILDTFAQTPRANVFVGTYNPQMDVIITDKEIIS